MNVHLSKVAFEAALALAQAEDKPLGRVIEPFLSYATANPSPESYLVYRLQAGDTLGTVARHFYGDGRKYSLLKKANNILKANELEEGLALIIPPTRTLVTTSFPTLLPSPNPYGPHPSPSVVELETLLSQALALTEEKTRVNALLALLPRLPEALVEEARAAAAEIEDIWQQSKLLAALASRLAELGNPAAALKLTEEIKRGWSQATALAHMAPYLPEPFQFQALALAQAVTKPEDRAAALIGLLPYLPDGLKAEVVAEAAATVERIEGEPLRVEARAGLLACLDALGYVPGVNAASGLEMPALSEELSSIAAPAEPELKIRVRPRTSPAKSKLFRHLNPIWAVPLLVLFLCGALLFTSGLALGSILLSDHDPSLERVELPSNGHSLVSRTFLEEGKFYSIVVAGRFNYNIDQPESWADAQSSYYQRTGDWVSAYWFSIDGQKVIAQQADPDNHLYLFYVQGSNRPLKFRLEERREAEYANNRGSLQVAIYSGLLNLDELEE
jgi:hypothetical protein